jgi:hypothetical protein
MKALRTLSLGQQRLWFVDQLFPDSPAYNVPYTMRLQGRLNVDALQNAVNEFVTRHEVLRTVIIPKDGQPIGLLKTDSSTDFKRIDLTNLPEDQCEIEADRLIHEEAQRPFNLAQDLMLRTALIRLAEDRHAFIHTAPHLSFEAGSLNVMYGELEELYNAFNSHRSPHLPDLPLQYVDYAVWQRRRLEGERSASLMNYWTHQLKGSSPINFPTDLARASTRSLRGDRYHWKIPPDLLQASHQFFHAAKTSPFRGLCAAFNVFLYSYSSREDILVSSPVATPRPPGAENLVGLFVNTLVFRTRLSREMTFHQLLFCLSKTVKEAIANSELGLDRIFAALNPPRDPSRTPLIQMNFRAPKAPLPTLRLHNIECTPPAYVDTRTSKFDLALEIESSEGLACYFEYSTDLFVKDTIARMAEDFQLVLRALLHCPDVPISELPEIQKLRRARSRV